MSRRTQFFPAMLVFFALVLAPGCGSEESPEEAGSPAAPESSTSSSTALDNELARLAQSEEIDICPDLQRLIEGPDPDEAEGLREAASRLRTIAGPLPHNLDVPTDVSDALLHIAETIDEIADSADTEFDGDVSAAGSAYYENVDPDTQAVTDAAYDVVRRHGAEECGI